MCIYEFLVHIYGVLESEAKYYYLATPSNVLKCPLSNSTGLSQLMYVSKQELQCVHVKMYT